MSPRFVDKGYDPERDAYVTDVQLAPGEVWCANPSVKIATVAMWPPELSASTMSDDPTYMEREP